MVINESALLRAMREDYKGQGYTVARRAEIEADPESESILLLSANDWMVEIGWKNVSAKIFGLVAEHMKGLPEVGQAFKVKKPDSTPKKQRDGFCPLSKWQGQQTKRCC